MCSIRHIQDFFFSGPSIHFARDARLCRNEKVRNSRPSIPIGVDLEEVVFAGRCAFPDTWYRCRWTRGQFRRIRANRGIRRLHLLICRGKNCDFDGLADVGRCLLSDSRIHSCALVPKAESALAAVAEDQGGKSYDWFSSAHAKSGFLVRQHLYRQPGKSTWPRAYHRHGYEKYNAYQPAAECQVSTIVVAHDI